MDVSRKVVRWMVAVLVAACLGHGTAVAQTSSTATLRGRVLDPAVAAGASRAGQSHGLGYWLVARRGERCQRSVPARRFASQRLRRHRHGIRLCAAALRIGGVAHRAGARSRGLADGGRREGRHRGRRGQRGTGRHRAVGRRCSDHGAVNRPAPAQRPQLHGAGAAGARQRAGAELRSYQDQLRGHLVGRAARPRRQHHHRRHGQQRRHGGRAAAQHRPGGRAGVPDRHQPVCRGPWTLGRLGHQRRHPLGQRRVARLRVAVLPRRRHAGRAGHGRPQPGSATV